MKTPLGLCLFLAGVFVLSLPANAQDSGLYTIFSNFGKGQNCFNLGEGWLVEGPGTGDAQYIAMKFTPTVDANVTEMKLALFGGRGAVVGLNEDDNGLPGKPIYTWHPHKLGNRGKSPCMYTLVTNKQGLPIHQGQQYWVVAEARGKEAAGWSWTNSGDGDFAYDDSNQGWMIEDANISAFDVLGTR